MAYRAGTAFIQITPSFKGFQLKMAAEAKKLSAIDIPVRLKVDTKAAEAEIAKATRDQHANVKVDADTATARRELDATEREVKRLDGQTARVHVKTDGIGAATQGLSLMTTAIVGLAPVAIPALATVSAGLGIFGGSLLAAGAAGGAFGASVIGQVKEMGKAQQNITRLQKAVDRYGASSKQGKKYTQELTAAQKDFNETFGHAAKGLDDVQSAWHKFLGGTQKVTLKVIGDGLEVVAGVLPKLVPLANAAGTAVGGLVADLGRFTKGREFRGFLDAFQRYGPRIIRDFGKAVGNVFLGVGNVFKAFLPFTSRFNSSLLGMTRNFRRWSEGLAGSKGFHDFMDYARKMLPQVRDLFGQLITFAKNLIVALGPLAGIELKAITGFLQRLNDLPPATFRVLVTSIAAVVLGLKAWALAAKAVVAYNVLLGTSGVAAGAGAAGAAGTAGAGAAGAEAAAAGGLLAGGRAVAVKGAAAAALAYVGAQVAMGVGSYFSHLGGRGNEKGVLSDFQKQRGGLGNALLGSGATFQNAAKVALGRNSLAERADQKVASFLGGDGTTKALSNIDKLDAAIVRLTRRNPAAGQRAFRDALDKSGLSAADFNKVLPKSAAALANLGSYFTKTRPMKDFRSALQNSGLSARQFATDLKRLPSQVVTKIGTPGAIKSLKDVIGLQKQFGLTPKQLVTAVVASGVKLTKASITDLQKRYHLTPAQVETLMVAKNVQALRNTAATQLAYSHVPHTIKTEAQFLATRAKGDTRSYRQYVNDQLSKIKRSIQIDISISRASQRIVNAAQSSNIRSALSPANKATGGAVFGPGTATSDSIPALLSNGEHVLTAREVHAFGGHGAVEAMRRRVLRRATGGPVTITPVTHAGRFGVGDINALYAALAKNLGTTLGRELKPALAALGAKQGPGGSGSYGVGRWAPLVLKVLSMFGFGSSWLSAGLHRINVESGGNPLAINLSDNNFRAGHPSQGLLQTIPSTFAAYAGPYRGRGITDPLANIYAGVNYALHRYNVPFVAGTKGYDSGGFIPPGVSTVYNGTGKPEPVLTTKQWADIRQVSAATSTQSGGRAVVNMENVYTQDPTELARVIERRQRMAFAMAGMP